MAEGPSESLIAGDPGPLPEPNEIAPRAEPKAAGKGKAPAKPRGKAAEAEELAALLAPAVGMTTYGFALLVASPDEPAVDAIAMTGEEADKVAEPLASILIRSSIFARYGRKLLAQSDWFKLAVALGEYGFRVYPLVSQKLGEKAGRRPIDHAQSIYQARATREQPSSNGTLPYDQLSGVYTAE